MLWPTKVFFKVASLEIMNKDWLSNVLIIVKKWAEYRINIKYVMYSARVQYLREVVDNKSEIEPVSAETVGSACVTDETKLWLSSRLNYV